MKKILVKIPILVIWVLLLVFLISWVSGFVDPSTFWQASLFSLLFPYAYIFLALVAVLGLIRRNHKAWGIIVLLLITSTTFRRSFFNISINPNRKDQKSFTVVSQNIGSSLKGNQRPDWRFYQNLQADIFCFQEWNEKTNAQWIKDSIHKNYPYHTLRSNPNLWSIFSRYPIIRQGELPSSTKGNGTSWADIAIGKDTIRIYNIHLVSNRISAQTEALFQRLGLSSANLWQRLRKVMVRYKNASLLRTAQAKALTKHMQSSPHPIVIAGDFNDIPSTYVYRLLAEDLKDAFLTAGTGMAYTYAGSLPFLAIDHILFDPRLTCLQIQIKKVNYSDHFPVKAKLSLR
jgi:endonuclease/exonuclease/phosphatase family metal-dependent hydrolase